jgi:hypothetical protein
MHFIVLTLLFGSGKIVSKLVNYMDKSSIVQSLSQGKKGYTMKKLLTVALVAAVACGCISVNKNDGGESNLRPTICKDCVHETYAVGDKTVSATETIQCVLNIFAWGSTASHIADQAEFSGFGPVAKAKNGAYAKACEAAKCDQIAGARYKITTEDYVVYKKVKCEITGYPVTMTGVKVVTPNCCNGGCPQAKK